MSKHLKGPKITSDPRGLTLKQNVMQCKIQNTGKTPVKNKYWKFLHINTVHCVLFHCKKTKQKKKNLCKIFQNVYSVATRYGYASRCSEINLCPQVRAWTQSLRRRISSNASQSGWKADLSSASLKEARQEQLVFSHLHLLYTVSCIPLMKILYMALFYFCLCAQEL